jgi:hypothetical protein
MNKRTNIPAVVDLEAEIGEALRLPPVVPFTTPKLHDLDELGRMSAEAVLTQYEATARAVEEMGNDVKDMVKRLGEKLIECDTDLKHLAETAAAIRDKGKHSQALIEQISSLSTSVRAACAEFKKKMEL